MADATSVTLPPAFFCDPDHMLEVLHHPWRWLDPHDGRAYEVQTDARMLAVRDARDGIPWLSEHSDINAAKLLEWLDGVSALSWQAGPWYTVDAEQIQLSACTTCKGQVEYYMRLCPSCGGEGMTSCDHCGSITTCDDCDGEGHLAADASNPKAIVETCEDCWGGVATRSVRLIAPDASRSGGIQAVFLRYLAEWRAQIRYVHVNESPFHTGTAYWAWRVVDSDCPWRFGLVMPITTTGVTTIEEITAREVK